MSTTPTLKEFRRELARVIRLSLNPDQAAYLAEQLDRRFDLREASGFGPHIAVPAHAAAETIVEHFREEDELLRYFELMLDRQGVFLFNSTIQVKGREQFLDMALKRHWVYDQDLKRFFRDPFFSDSINFLRSIERLDLRKASEAEINDLRANVQEHAEKLRAVDLEWRIGLRMYRLDRPRDRLLQQVVELLLVRQNLEPRAYEIYYCLKELALNAAKANYKHIFDLHMDRPQDDEDDYAAMLERFRLELEENGDANVGRKAEELDLFVDLAFKSTADAIVIWITNYVPIKKIEKERMLDKMNLSREDQHSFQAPDDEHREGAGLGLAMVMRILTHYSGQAAPLNVVFYPNATKVGFTLRRADLAGKEPQLPNR